MTAADPDHSHHCSCAKLPPDVWRRIQSAYMRYGEAFCRELLRVVTGARDHTSPALSTHRPRFLDKVTPPDEQGHQYYLGAWPRYGVPRAMHQGRTLEIPHWLWNWNSLDFAPLSEQDHLTRTCRNPHCVSPDHHKPAAAPPERLADIYAQHHDLLAWEAVHPKPLNPRSVAWLQGIDFTGERCQAGHRIRVYPGPKRKSYCAECAVTMRKWETLRKAEIRRIESHMTGLPVRVPNESAFEAFYPDAAVHDPPPAKPLDGPEFLDQILAGLDDDSPDLEPEDTLAGMVQRMYAQSPEETP